MEGQFTEEEGKALRDVTLRFLDAYAKKGEVDDKVWLEETLHQEMPEKSKEETDEMAEDILSRISIFDQNMESLNEATARGETKESWAARTLMDSARGKNIQQFGDYLHGVDQALAEGNEAMRRVILTKSGAVSGNPNLDGFIAEQQHVNTFNAKAALENRGYRAEVLSPGPGETYGKNSVDVQIREIHREASFKGGRAVTKQVKGKTLERYQLKYGKDAKASANMVKHGDYRNQQVTVPKGQASEAGRRVGGNKTVKDHIGGTDKVETASNPYSKKQAQRARDAVQQKGKLPKKQTWNSFNTKTVALNIGKQAAYVGMQGAAMGAGIEMASQLMKGQKIDGEKVVETALKTGADAGVKAAAAGALKVAVERGIVPFLSKSSPVTEIACAAVEGVKVLADDSLTVTQKMDGVAKASVATYTGLTVAGEGAAIGAAALSFIPVVGTAVGGFLGGIVGYAAGSTVGQKLYQGAKKVASAAVSVVKSAARAVTSAVSTVASGIGSVVSGIFSLF